LIDVDRGSLINIIDIFVVKLFENKNINKNTHLNIKEKNLNETLDLLFLIKNYVIINNIY